MKKMLQTAVLALALGAVAMPVLAASNSSDPVAAKVNGQEIHYSEIEREARNLGPQAQQLPPQVLLPQLIEKLAVTKIFAKQGYDQKLQGDTEVKARMKQIEEQLVAEAYVRKVITPKITEAKIKERYDQLSSKYVPEDEVRASHILVQTEDEANAIIKQLKDGADFAKLAGEKSKDTGSAKQGGDLGYFDKKAMVKPFADAAFSMKVGEISEKPVKSDFGYHVIKLVDKRKSAAPKIDDVKEQLGAQIGQEMAQALVKETLSKAKIEKFNPDGTPMKDIKPVEPAKK
jgi:peptidyl-prolyl cis-trans isomerase C